VNSSKYEYDVARLKEQARTFAISVFTMVVMHFQMDAVRPILFFALTQPFSVLESQLFRYVAITVHHAHDLI
jgi:hypothetical protein